MKNMRLEFEPALAKLDPLMWMERVEQISDDLGYFEQLGDDHAAAFLDAGPKLFVSFENAETVRKTNPGAEPRGFAFARTEGWSCLTLLSDGESWFRDSAVFRYIDRLIDDGFFEDYDKIVFHGCHAAAYAAAAFSVAAPGSVVLAIRPQATLDPRVAGWDPRYTTHRRTNFTDRYGFAPDMIDAAGHAFIAFDPNQRFDAIHAALFTRPNVSQLRCAGLGWKLDSAFDAMGFHNNMIKQAMSGTLDDTSFADLYRARRSYAPYLRSVVNRLQATGHPQLAANFCAYMLHKGQDPFYESKLLDLTEQGYTADAPVNVSAAE